MTMSSHNTMRLPSDHPHYAWLREQLNNAVQEGDQGAILLLKEGLDFAQACNAAWHRILESCQGKLIGMEVANTKLTRYAVILKDASEPGRFRAQYFDAHGFSGHSTCNSPEEVLQQLVEDGYREPAVGAMNELSQTKGWSLGTLVTNLIAKVNAGKMSYAAMLKERSLAEARLVEPISG